MPFKAKPQNSSPAFKGEIPPSMMGCKFMKGVSDTKVTQDHHLGFMNAHFILSSLTSIQHFILKNERKESVKYLSSFSQLIRFVMEHYDKDEVKLGRALEFIQKYVDLESSQCELEIDFKMIVSPQVDKEKIAIPPMLLQPYVENAILHGLLPQSGKLKLSISIDKIDDNVLIQIEDNGIGISKSKMMNPVNSTRRSSSEVNMERMRLRKETSNTPFCITVNDKPENANESGTIVTILLKFKEETLSGDALKYITN